jgi:hypothetical protein
MTPRITAGSGRKRINWSADSGAKRHVKSRVLERKLHPGERAEHLEIAEPTQVSDPEHLPLELAQAHAERKVQPLGRLLDDAVGVDLPIDSDRGK